MGTFPQLRRIITDRLFNRRGIFVIDIAGERVERIVPLDRPTATKLVAEADTLDARGKLVLPGFIDSHCHTLASARYLLQIDLFGVSSLDEMVERIRSAPQFAADFVLAGRLDRMRLPESSRTAIRATLDAAFPDKPLRIGSIEGHSSWLNGAAWERLKVDQLAQRLGLPAEELAAMRESGIVHGKLGEALSEALYSTYSESERRSALAQLLDTLPARGITTLHCLEGYGSDPSIDFRVILDADTSREDIDLVLYPRTRKVELASELGLHRIGGCILVDGAIGARTAAMSKPYADCPGEQGMLYFTDEELLSFVRQSAEAGLQLALHAIGDAAIEQVLRTYEELAKEFDLAALRPRIEHFVAGTRSQFERAAKLGLASGMQPAFDYFWGGTKGGYVQALGEKRGMRTNPLATALDCGLTVGGGSDSPITPLQPRLGIYAAVNHHAESERLSFAQAVGLFTTGSASLAHEEKEKGRIAEGFLADLVVMPGTTDGSNIHEQPVLVTIKRGRVVHTNSQ